MKDKFCDKCEYLALVVRESDLPKDTGEYYCNKRALELIPIALWSKNKINFSISIFNHSEFEYPADCPYALERVLSV